MINVDDDEENLNKEIISQDDEHYDNIELDEVFFFFDRMNQMKLIEQDDEYDEK